MPTPGRRRILSAALVLFAERGFASTSMRDLAAQVGMKPASLYSHYPGGKDEMLGCALEPFLTGLDYLLDDNTSDLDQWLRAYAAHLAQHRHAARLTGADLAVNTHQNVAQRINVLNQQTRRRIRADTDLDELGAAAALGALWWPLICLPHPVTEQELVELATATAHRTAT